MFEQSLLSQFLIVVSNLHNKTEEIKIPTEYLIDTALQLCIHIYSYGNNCDHSHSLYDLQVQFISRVIFITERNFQFRPALNHV